MDERKHGWYWCIMDGALFPIYYSGGVWWKGGHALNEEPRIVSHRIPTPEEPWQCVPKEPTDEMADEIEACIDGVDGWFNALEVAPKP